MPNLLLGLLDQVLNCYLAREDVPADIIEMSLGELNIQQNESDSEASFESENESCDYSSFEDDTDYFME